jgi:sugar porter (SP) family MFS transporter
MPDGPSQVRYSILLLGVPVADIYPGLGVGSSSLIIPVYISESSPPAIRGRLIGIFEILLQISQLPGFWVNYGVNKNMPQSDAQWRIPFGIQLVPGVMLMILMSLQTESPRFLAKKGKYDQVRQVLSKIRKLPGDHEYIEWEISTIRAQLDNEASETATTFFGKVKTIFTTNVRTRLLTGMALMIFQNLSGINALNYYSPVIVASIGFTGTDTGLLATGVFGIVKATGTVIFMLFIIDRYGRRRALLIGSAGATVAMYYLGGYSSITNSFNEEPPRDGGAYVALVMVYIFAIFYSISWNGIPWIFCAEVFPTALRQACLVFTTCTQWLGQFIIAYSTPYMIEDIEFGTFIFFGTSVVCGMVFSYFFLPETKGVALEDMDIMFESKGFAHQKRKNLDAVLAERREIVAEEHIHAREKRDVHEAERVESV